MKAFSNKNLSFPQLKDFSVGFCVRLYRTTLAVTLLSTLIQGTTLAAAQQTSKASWQLLEKTIGTTAESLGLVKSGGPEAKSWHQKQGRFFGQSLPLIESEAQGVAMFNAWLKDAGLGGGALIPAQSPAGAWLNLEQKAPFRILLGYGVTFTRLGTKWHIDQVLLQSPADRAGLKRGDRLVSADSSLEKECTPASCTLLVQKTLHGSEQKVTLKPDNKSLDEMLYRDTEQSDRIILASQPQATQPLKIGYTRLLGSRFAHRDELLQSIASRMQRQADIWLLDLRGGVPSGAEDLSRWFFFQDKNGKRTEPVFSKPLAIIIDEATAGDRERLALIVQQQNRGVILGTESLGRPWPVTFRQVAQEPYWVAWPETLHHESLSLMPDYELKPDLTYAAGQDAALEKSLLVLSQLDISRGKADDTNAAKSKTH